MKKIFDRTTVLTTIATLLPIAAALPFYDRLPEQMAIHFTAQGVADRWASRPFAVFALPLLLAAFNIVLQFMLLTDPKREPKSQLFRLARWTVAPISVLATTMTLLIALDVPIKIERIIPLAAAILFLAIGNYLPKSKQSYTIGIKLPWTLASEQNWNKTHRLAGWVWTASSLLMIIVVLAGRWVMTLFLVITALMVLIPITYSYLIYRTEEPTDSA